jgi:two-component system, NarL family, nitrate/nitrite response regulator NarL
MQRSYDPEKTLTRVVLVQPHKGTEALHDALTAAPRFLVSRYSCAAAAGQAYAHVPDVVVIDLDTAGDESRDLIHALHAYWPTCPLVVVSPAPSLEQLNALLMTGARGYLHWPLPTPDLLAALQLAASGGLALCPHTAPLLMRLLLPALTRQATMLAFSPREVAISERISTGLSNKIIAQELNIATKTVEWYVARLLQKTNMRSRVELAVWWSHNPAAATGQQRDRAN